MILADSDDNDEAILGEMMEAIWPENFEEMQREPLEGGIILVRFDIHGKGKYLLHWRNYVLQR
jgi:hypothetical protein